MTNTQNTEVPSFSDWQTKRLRSRLLVYIVDQERKSRRKPSWSSIANDINTCKAVLYWTENWDFDYDDEAEEPSDGSEEQLAGDIPEYIHTDSGMPITQNVVSKFVDGENRTDANGQTYRHFTTPSKIRLKIIEEFLRYKNLISGYDLIDENINLTFVDGLVSYLNPGGDATILPQDDPINGDLLYHHHAAPSFTSHALAIHLDKSRRFHRVRERRRQFIARHGEAGQVFWQRTEREMPDRMSIYQGFAVKFPNGRMTYFLTRSGNSKKFTIQYISKRAPLNSDNKLETLELIEYCNLESEGENEEFVEKLLKYTPPTDSLILNLLKNRARVENRVAETSEGSEFRFYGSASKKDEIIEHDISRRAEQKEHMTQDELGKKLLEAADFGGTDEELFALIDQGADINYVDPQSKTTVLHQAAACAARYLVEQLIERYGDRLNFLAKNREGRLPSTLAVEVGEAPDLAELLINREMDQAERAGIDYRNLLTEEPQSMDGPA